MIVCQMCHQPVRVDTGSIDTVLDGVENRDGIVSVLPLSLTWTGLFYVLATDNRVKYICRECLGKLPEDNEIRVMFDGMPSIMFEAMRQIMKEVEVLRHKRLDS